MKVCEDLHSVPPNKGTDEFFVREGFFSFPCPRRKTNQFPWWRTRLPRPPCAPLELWDKMPVCHVALRTGYGDGDLRNVRRDTKLVFETDRNSPRRPCDRPRRNVGRGISPRHHSRGFGQSKIYNVLTTWAKRSQKVSFLLWFFAE